MDAVAAGAAFAVNFIYVFLRAMQQLNVVNRNYGWVMPMSLGMGLCEVATVLLVVRTNSLLMGLVVGIGAGLGAMLAMKVHPILTRR